MVKMSAEDTEGGATGGEGNKSDDEVMEIVRAFSDFCGLEDNQVSRE